MMSKIPVTMKNKTVLNAMLFLSLINLVVSSNPMNLLRYSQRNLIEKTKFNCTGLPAKCKCPYPCLEQVKNENYCLAKKCYEVDKNLGECKEKGYDHVAPLVLQAIPFTGVFGSGFANMGRWDLFGVYMTIFFGGCCFILMSALCCLCCCNNDEELESEGTDKETFIKCAGQCGYCIWAVAILVFYILGIVWTATPGGVLDVNGCPLLF